MARTSTSSSAGTKSWDILEEVGAGTPVEHSGIPDGREITLLQHCSSCLSEYCVLMHTQCYVYI